MGSSTFLQNTLFPNPDEKAPGNKARLSIFGLGYVGAVSAACFAQCSHMIMGVDPDKKKIEKISKGLSPIVETGLELLLTEGVSKGLIFATTDAAAAIHSSDVSFVCVGTPSAADGQCDLTYLRKVSTQIGAALANKKGYHVIVFRSTVPPGTTRNVMLPILEKFSGKKAGVDFGLCFHPEFLRESTAISDFYEPPKTVVGGIDKRSILAVIDLYRGITDDIIETNLEVAEMIKYVDNSWHALKVSFSNEIGNICQALNVDSHSVMDIFVQDTKLNISPYYLKPGFAFGGSCLPKDVRGLNRLAESLNVETPVLSSINTSNGTQVDHAVDLIADTKPKTVAFLGITFKAKTDDLRESPVLTLMAKLLGQGINVKFYDPNIDLNSSVRHHIHASGHAKGDEELSKAKLPHLICDSINAAVKDADTIVVCHGTELFRHAITNRQPHQKVVDLVRIFGGEYAWPEMAASGMDDYVQKPASAKMLTEKLGRWTGRENEVLKILVAEDEVPNAAVIKAKLAKSGHDVHIVNTGDEAVRAVQAEEYDLVFMDIEMPSMGGIEATVCIRAMPNACAAVPIIALTGHAAPELCDTYKGICW